LLEPGESCFAQLFLQTPAVTTWNQPIVLRSESPVTTIGGGQVAHPNADRIRQLLDSDKEMLGKSISDAPLERADAALYFAGFRGWDPSELPRTAGVVSIESTCEQLLADQTLVELPISPTRSFRLHRLRLEQIAERIEAVLGGLHDRFPLRTYLDRSTVRNAFLYLPEIALFDAAIEWLKTNKRVQTNTLGIALKGRGPKLSQNEQKLLAQLVTWFADGGMEPPTIEQCQANATKNKDSVPQLIGLAVANGDLVEVGSGLYFHRDTDRWIRDTVGEKLQGLETGATMAEIRDALGTTRKYAVPICEYLDRVGLTTRDGDVRRLANQAEVAVQNDSNS
jgi:selenocysteine-specific elongation factor